VVVVDNEWRALTANQAFSDTMCVSPLDVSGKALFEICGGVLDLPALRAALTATVEHDTPFHGLEVELQIDGAIRTLSTSANSTRGPAGERLVIVALQDVSERKRGEVERARLLLDTQEAKTEAERANAAKDLFLAVLSHELRTPLSTMLIQTQRLLRNDLPRPKLDLAIQTIERALKMQAQLIDDLLDVARIASGKLKLQPQTMDLGPVVATAIDAVSSLAERKSITIEATLPDDDAIGTISGDPTRLRQVVWNLLSNAIKYTPEGGRVTLTLDGHEDQARIQVSDTGRGLDPELLPHIFERWIQAESVSTRAHGGLGLGLAIVKNVVEAHGGTVFAQSPGLDQGATFTVLLPLLHAGEHGLSDVTSVEETPDVREIDGGSSLRGVRVLIVDDDAGLREVIAEILAEEGAVVWKSPSAADARGVMTGFKPQVLLSDMAMPGEDGVSLLKGIRADGYTIPAVALSGLASAEDRRRALSAGFETYLTKPINAERLTGAVVAAAARR
jgi:two-component system, chemotaxis family, CheB/CheR fusion protein